MTDILIWTLVVLVAGFVTAIIMWVDSCRDKPKTHEVDSAEVIRALRRKK